MITTPKLTHDGDWGDYESKGFYGEEYWPTIGVCGKLLREYFGIPRGAKHLWFRFSTRPGPNRHEIFFTKDQACIQHPVRGECMEELYSGASRWLRENGLIDKTLYVEVQYT